VLKPVHYRKVNGNKIKSKNSDANQKNGYKGMVGGQKIRHSFRFTGNT